MGLACENCHCEVLVLVIALIAQELKDFFDYFAVAALSNLLFYSRYRSSCCICAILKFTPFFYRKLFSAAHLFSWPRYMQKKKKLLNKLSGSRITFTFIEQGGRSVSIVKSWAPHHNKLQFWMGWFFHTQGFRNVLIQRLCQMVAFRCYYQTEFYVHMLCCFQNKIFTSVQTQPLNKNKVANRYFIYFPHYYNKVLQKSWKVIST